MPITHLTSVSQLDGILKQSKDKVSVIDFHATWCGPCHAIAPTFEALSTKYPNVNFLKCDVDAAPDVSQKYRVSAMPTFVFLRGDSKVDQVRGADKSGLTATVKKHASSSPPSGTAAFSGKGHTLSSSSSAPTYNSSDSAREAADVAQGYWASLDPQLKVFVGLVGAYGLLWYLS